MSDKKRLRLAQKAALALRAGVVLTLEDWKHMKRGEQLAWIAAREAIAREKVTGPATQNGTALPPIPPGLHDELVKSAIRIVAGAGSGRR